MFQLPFNINLTPWREARRVKLQQRFQQGMVFSAIAGVGLVVAGWLLLSSAISGQSRRNDYLQKNIDAAQDQIEEIETLDEKRNRLLGRQRVIEELQSNRTMMSHLLYDIAAASLDGMILEGMQHQKDMLEIRGRATGNSVVSNYLLRLEQSQWMGTPELVVVAGRESGMTDTAFSNDPEMIKAFPVAFALKVAISNPYSAPAKDSAETASPGTNDKKPIQKADQKSD